MGIRRRLESIASDCTHRLWYPTGIELGGESNGSADDNIETLGAWSIWSESEDGEMIQWMSKAVNSLSVRENRGGHLCNPLLVEGQ